MTTYTPVKRESDTQLLNRIRILRKTLRFCREWLRHTQTIPADSTGLIQRIDKVLAARRKK